MSLGVGTERMGASVDDSGATTGVDGGVRDESFDGVVPRSDREAADAEAETKNSCRGCAVLTINKALPTPGQLIGMLINVPAGLARDATAEIGTGAELVTAFGMK